MLDKTLIRNISSLFSIRVAGYIIPLITLPYLVRVLNPEGYGTLALCLAVVQYFIIAVNYGFDLSATQKVAQNKHDKDETSTIYWNVISARLILSCLGLIVLAALTSFVPKLAPLQTILYCCYLAVFGAALFPQWIFQGKEQLGTISVIRIIVQVVSIPLFFVFVKSANDIWIAALVTSAPQLGIVIFSSVIIYKRKWVCWKKPSMANIMLELKDGWHLFISTAAISLYTTSTTVILGFLTGPISVGIYVSANKLLQAAQGVYAPISSSFYPRINSLMKEDKNQALIMIRYLMKFQCLITLAIGVLLFALSPYLIDILFGAGYERSIIVLKIMSVLPIVIGLSNIFGIQVLLTHGFKKEFSRILLFSGVVSLTTLIPLCLTLDAVGAALSVVITEVIVTVLMFITIKMKNIPLFKNSGLQNEI